MSDKDFCHTCKCWVAAIAKPAKPEDLPACPKCGKVLFEAMTRKERRRRGQKLCG